MTMDAAPMFVRGFRRAAPKHVRQIWMSDVVAGAVGLGIALPAVYEWHRRWTASVHRQHPTHYQSQANEEALQRLGGVDDVFEQQIKQMNRFTTAIKRPAFEMGASEAFDLLASNDEAPFRSFACASPEKCDVCWRITPVRVPDRGPPCVVCG